MGAEAMPFRPANGNADGGIRVDLRVTPGARHTRVQGVVADADGGPILQLSVSAPAEGGKANAAAIKLLAKSWRVPKSDLEIVKGATARRKTLLLHGADAATHKRLETWLGTLT